MRVGSGVLPRSWSTQFLSLAGAWSLCGEALLLPSASRCRPCCLLGRPTGFRGRLMPGTVAGEPWAGRVGVTTWLLAGDVLRASGLAASPVAAVGVTLRWTCGSGA